MNCVNALEGIENPAAVREVLKIARASVPYLQAAIAGRIRKLDLELLVDDFLETLARRDRPSGGEPDVEPLDQSGTTSETRP